MKKLLILSLLALTACAQPEQVSKQPTPEPTGVRTCFQAEHEWVCPSAPPAPQYNVLR